MAQYTRRGWIKPAMVIFGSQLANAKQGDKKKPKFQGPACSESVIRYGATCGIRQGNACAIREGQQCKPRIGQQCQERIGPQCGADRIGQPCDPDRLGQHCKYNDDTTDNNDD